MKIVINKLEQYLFLTNDQKKVIKIKFNYQWNSWVTLFLIACLAFSASVILIIMLGFANTIRDGQINEEINTSIDIIDEIFNSLFPINISSWFSSSYNFWIIFGWFILGIGIFLTILFTIISGYFLYKKSNVKKELIFYLNQNYYPQNDWERYILINWFGLFYHKNK